MKVAVFEEIRLTIETSTATQINSMIINPHNISELPKINSIILGVEAHHIDTTPVIMSANVIHAYTFVMKRDCSA
jgi:hypothetical protein